jgi:hypothetical protein
VFPDVFRTGTDSRATGFFSTIETKLLSSTLAPSSSWRSPEYSNHLAGIEKLANQVGLNLHVVS